MLKLIGTYSKAVKYKIQSYETQVLHTNTYFAHVCVLSKKSSYLSIKQKKSGVMLTQVIHMIELYICQRKHEHIGRHTYKYTAKVSVCFILKLSDSLIFILELIKIS